MTRSGFSLALLCFVLGMTLGNEIQAAAPAGKADALRARAASSGVVRVIVEIDAPKQAIGGLAPTLRSAQVQTIANVQAAIAQQVAARRASPSGLQEVTRFRFIPFMVYVVDSAGVDVLAGLPQVTNLYEDVPEAPVLASSLPVIGAAAAWAEGYDGTGQAVVVLDTGVDATHPFFPPAKLIAEACYSTNGEVSTSFCPGQVASSTAVGSGANCPINVAGCDHGTHVAGIAVGNDSVGPNIGVARGAGLIPMQVFSRFNTLQFCGSSPPCALAYQADQISALERILVLSDTIDIASVNISIGSSTTFASQATCDSGNVARKAAIDNLRSAGIPTIIASGNSSSRSGLSQPGCISTAISVGNTTDDDQVAASSNVSAFLDLLAPGSNITSSVPGNGVAAKSGTSMAAPHVAGAWAVLREVDPQATIDELLEILRDTAESIDDQRSGGTVTDMRRINLDLAVMQLILPQAVFESSPLAGSTVDFGSVDVGASSAVLDVVVGNTGDAELTLLCNLFGDDAGSFTVVACPGPIAPAASDDVMVRCDPLDGGNLTAVLQLSTNAPGTPEASYNLACGGAGPEVEANPLAGEEFDFGEVQNATESGLMFVQLSNSGNQALTVGCVLTGTDDTQFTITACPVSVSALGMEMVQFRCVPSTTGSFAATLEISTNDQNEPLLTYPLVCDGVEPELDADPDTGSTLDFAYVDVGTQSSSQYITLENNGTGELLLTCGLTGAHMEQFSVVNCPEGIAASDNHVLELVCEPDSLGNLSAQLLLASNDADEPSLVYDLLCNGVSPELDPDPPAGSLLDFGAVYTGESSELEQLLIENTGNSVLALACGLQGADTDSFEVLQCPASVEQGQAGNVQLRCSPLSEGTKSAQLVLGSNDLDEPETIYNLACDVTDRPDLVFEDSFEDSPPEP